MAILINGSLFVPLRTAKAAPVYDQTNGTYTDNFANNAGVPTRSQVNVDPGTGVLQLTRNGNLNLFTAPFYTSGSARTSSSIIPTSVAAWQTVAFTAVKPPNTSLYIQIADGSGALYSDIVLPGNSAGFTTSPVDISALSPLMHTGAHTTLGRIQIKINFASTDSAVTPTFDDLVVSWTPKQGDLTATTLNTADWPANNLNNEATRHTTTRNSAGYSAFRWAADKNLTYDDAPEPFVYNGQLIVVSSLDGQNDTSDCIKSYDVDTGEIKWQLPFTAVGSFAIGQNGTGYLADGNGVNIISAIDLNTGAIKWTYNLAGGLANNSVLIGTDGTIYTICSPSNTNTVRLYALRPDGTLYWTQNITQADAQYLIPHYLSQGSDGTLYFGTSDMETVNYTFTNHGKLYAIDPDPITHNVKWSYATGDTLYSVAPIIDSDGTIYVFNMTDPGYTKNVTAINPNGTLKWSEGYGNTSDYGYTAPVLRDDNVLLTKRMLDITGDFWGNTTDQIQAIDTRDGSLLWEKSADTSVIGLSDSINNVYASQISPGDTAHDWIANTGYYDTNFNNIWRVAWPFSDINGSNWTQYSFGNATYTSLIADDRGWLYGSLEKTTIDNPIDYNNVWDEQFTQYFALAPWTLSMSGLSGTVDPGDTVTLTATTAMQLTNPLLGGESQMQAVMDNGDKVTMSYLSTDDNGDTIWTGSYTIPADITSGDHTFTIEASQSYMQTNIVTHFANASLESGNTGLSASGTFRILGASSSNNDSTSLSDVITLPEVGANLNQLQYLFFKLLTSYH